MALLSCETNFNAVSSILARLTGLDATAQGIRKVSEAIGARVADEREAELPKDSQASRLPDRSAPSGRTLVLQVDGVSGLYTDGPHEAMEGVVTQVIQRKDGRLELEKLEV